MTRASTGDGTEAETGNTTETEDGRPPVLDARDRGRLLADARAIVPFYTPKWDATTEDAGTALLELFTTMSADVVDRLNEVPEKHRTAFFDALGFGRAPPQSARLPLSFTVDEGLDRNVAVPARTRATATTADGGEQLFEVAPPDAFEATPARVERVYGVDPGVDRLFDLQGPLEPGDRADLFGGTDVQRHAVYVGDADALALPPGSAVSLTFETETPATLFWTFEYHYYGTRLEATDDADEPEEVEGWHRLRIEGVEAGDGVVEVRARIPGTAVELSETTVNGVESRWIRCQLQQGPPRSDRPAGVYDVEVASVSIGTDERTLQPDLMLANDVPVPVESGATVLPFGEQPQVVDTFYLSSEAAFTKRGTKVCLSIDVEDGAAQGAVGASVSWQYWNGSTWARLDGMKYDNGGEWLPVGDSTGTPIRQLISDGTLRFRVPDDLEPTVVSGNDGYWIRVQLVDGTYGRVTYVKSTGGGDGGGGGNGDGSGGGDGSGSGGGNGGGSGGGGTSTDSEQWSVSLTDVRVPRIESVTVGYGFDAGSRSEHLFTHNNHSYSDPLDDVSPRRIRLFEPPRDETQTLSVGFDRPLQGGPLQLYFPLVDREYPGSFVSRTRWEVCDSGGRWSPLDAQDGTDGLTRTGIVSLAFAEPTTECRLFGETHHWIRARFVGREFESPAVEWTPPPDRDPDLTMTVHLLGVNPRSFIWTTLKNEGQRSIDLSAYLLDFAAGHPTEALGRFRPGATLDPGERLVITGADQRFTWDDGTDRYYGDLYRFDDLDFADDRLALLTGEGKSTSITARFYRPGLGVEPPDVTDRQVVTSGQGGAEPTSPTGPFPVSPVTPQCPTPPPDSPPTPASPPEQHTEPAERERCRRTLETDPPTGPPTRTPPTLRGLYPNTGWVTNVSRVEDELLGSSDGTPDQEFAVATPPALDAAVWVDELTVLSEAAQTELESTWPDDVDHVVGAAGETRAFWVRWTAVEGFLASGPADRHYTVDPTAGRITFGDGTRGAVPPRGRDNVRADYETGGGADGNVTAGAVSGLVSSIAFVTDVTNPDPSDGGADAESITSTLVRAPQALRDRGRAVTAADYERLALSASRRLARAACVPELDRDGDRTPGWVTVLVVPQSSERRPTPSTTLRRAVYDRLAEHAPASVVGADPSRLVVRGPSYVEVGVTAEVVAGDVGSLSTVETAATEALTAYLHPLSGAPGGMGWRFGELPCLSDCYALLEGLDGVDHVASLRVTFRGATDAVTVGEDDSVPSVAGDTLAYSGNHDVVVRRTDRPVAPDPGGDRSQ